MTLIGMLHHRSDPRKVLKFYAFAAVARAEGVEFFYFTPRKVNFINKMIQGKVLEKGKWTEKNMPFPDVIYNAGKAVSHKTRKIHQKLSEQIPFTSHAVGNKITVYQRLKDHKKFSRFLLPTTIITNPQTVFQSLDIYKKVVVKPVPGCQGKGIVFIDKNETGYTVLEQNHSTSHSKESLTEFITNLLSEKKYLIQPYLACKTKSGMAYDFRLLVQKNGEGKWVITAIYPRIASSGRLVTNLASGGYTCKLDHFLIQEFGEHHLICPPVS
ncbi:YheC/YheD family protein [Paenactinomyces guangxiensis]|uniref:YheC/YheD family protein n=1 Tax=Paenactinomyces guangxiensis TaxID=1490290 RepID=UPI001E3DB465|nr:YheC/YheD family protein [Paenactinomyces guangxiensis]